MIELGEREMWTNGDNPKPSELLSLVGVSLGGLGIGIFISHIYRLVIGDTEVTKFSYSIM